MAAHFLNSWVPCLAPEPASLFATALWNPLEIRNRMEQGRQLWEFVENTTARPCDLSKRPTELTQEDRGGRPASQYDSFSRNTRNQIKQVFDALRELMTPPEPPRRPIGFVAPEDNGQKGSASARSKV